MSFLLRFLLFGALLLLIAKWLWKIPAARRRQGKRPGSASAGVEEMKRDPVCGVFIPESQAVILEAKGETLHFCSRECREKFLRSAP